MTVPIKWHGYPGHFICAARCLFRLHTTVGRYRISSVGDYRPNMNRSGDGMGERDTLSSWEQSFFECYIFLPKDSGIENGDSRRFATAEECTAYHMKMVRKYAAKANREAAKRRKR